MTRKLLKDFIYPFIFKLYVFGFLKGKILSDCQKIRTHAFLFLWIVRTADYQLGHAPLLQSLLEVRVSKSIYKDV
jgi:hypothetical protein